jgi:very-short-patch-repair endonuclease
MRLDGVIDELAAAQHSLVAVWQLQALGLDDTEVWRLRQGERWRPVTCRVLALVGGVDTDDRTDLAAVLDASPGAVLSHGAAARRWGAPGFGTDRLHLTRHRGVSRRISPLAKVHEVIDLLPEHVKEVRGVPLTSPARTVFDLAGSLHPARAERLLDWMWNERLLDGRTLDRTVSDLAARGRTGSALMRELATDRGPDYVPPASGLEARFVQILQRAGIASMRRQVDSGDGQWVGRVDFRDRELPLVAEINSEKHHTSLVDRAADAARTAALEAAGFTVLVFWDTQVWHDPDTVAAQVAAARRHLSSHDGSPTSV